MSGLFGLVTCVPSWAPSARPLASFPLAPVRLEHPSLGRALFPLAPPSAVGFPLAVAGLVPHVAVGLVARLLLWL